jgi:hypothetical protein
MLSPLLVENYAQLHQVFPSGPGKTAFLTTYEDFHAYNKRTDWYTLRATWGIQGILKRRLHTARENLGQVEYFMDPALAWLTVAALVDVALVQRRFARLRPLIPVATFALLEYLFYTFVAAFSGPGSLIKCLGALMPFFCLVIVDALLLRIKSTPLALGLVLLVSAYSAHQGFTRNVASATYYNEIYDNYRYVRTAVRQDARLHGTKAADITLMARDTWDVFEGTGFKTVMIPNNDLETILEVARHYGVDYMLLPAPRKALEDIYLGTTPDPHFEYVASVPATDWSLFRLNLSPP